MSTHPLRTPGARAYFVTGSALRDLASLPLIVALALLLSSVQTVDVTLLTVILSVVCIGCVYLGARLRQRAWNATPRTIDAGDAPMWHDVVRETIGYGFMAAIPLVCVTSGSALGVVLAVLASGFLIGVVVVDGIAAHSSRSPRRRTIALLRIPVTIAIQLAVLSELLGAAATIPNGVVLLGMPLAFSVAIGAAAGGITHRAVSGR